MSNFNLISSALYFLLPLIILYINYIGNFGSWYVQDPAGLNLNSNKWQDVNVVISLLKLFFRKLPESLVTTGKCCNHLNISLD